jgi:hypothetical protein
MKTVRELTVACPCIALGDVLLGKLLRASAIEIAAACRNSSANIGWRCISSPVHQPDDCSGLKYPYDSQD